MRSAEHQAKLTPARMKIACSKERIKRMVCAAQEGKPDQPIETGSDVKEWELVTDAEIVSYINFANLFLYTGGAVICLVDEEPEARRIVL